LVVSNLKIAERLKKALDEAIKLAKTRNGKRDGIIIVSKSEIPFFMPFVAASG
jgi:hypothetical protein